MLHHILLKFMWETMPINQRRRNFLKGGLAVLTAPLLPVEKKTILPVVTMIEFPYAGDVSFWAETYRMYRETGREDELLNLVAAEKQFPFSSVYGEMSGIRRFSAVSSYFMPSDKFIPAQENSIGIPGKSEALPSPDVYTNNSAEFYEAHVPPGRLELGTQVHHPPLRRIA